MEEDKTIKRKKCFKLISKILSSITLVILSLIALFLIVYIITNKIAKSKGENPPFGLYTIISPSMTPEIKVYDVVFIVKTNTDKLKKGDIITFFSTNAFFGGTPITHRIDEVTTDNDGNKVFRTKGDANQKADTEKVSPDNVVGKVICVIPQLGRIQFFLASKGGWIIGIMIPALAIIAYDLYKIFRLILLKNKLQSLENENGNI